MKADRADARLTTLETQIGWIYPLLVVVVLLLRMVLIHPHTPLFYDEIVTYEIVTAPWETFRATLKEGHLDTLTAGYGLMFVWVRLFGTSTLGLRLMFTLCSAGSVLLLWDSLRRAFGSGAASLATTVLVICGYAWLYYSGYARIYGLLFLLIAVAIRLLVEGQLQPQWPASQWGLTWLTHAALVLTHPFGAVYSATLLAAQITLDLLDRRVRPLRWAAIPMGWLAFLLIAPDLILHTVNSGGMWRSSGSLGALLSLYGWDHNILVLPYFVVMGVAWLWKRPPQREMEAEAGSRSRSLLWIALWMSLAPLGILLVSQTLIEVFVPRYLLPQLMATAIFGAAVYAPLAGPDPEAPAAGGLNRVALPMLGVIAAMVGVIASAVSNPGRGALTLQLDADLAGLPVIIESSQVFAEMSFYEGEGSAYWFIAAPEAENVLPALLSAEIDARNMLALERVDPRYQVATPEEFAATYDRFLLMDADFFGYSERYLESNPAYHIEPLGWPLPYLQLLLVERIDAP